MNRPHNNSRGFTLVEALVSLVVFSGVLFAAGILLSSALKSQERAARDARAAGRMAAVSAVLEGDLRGAVAIRGGGHRSAWAEQEAEPDLEMLCVGRPRDPRFDGGLAVVRVRYRLEGPSLLRAEDWIDGRGRSGSFESALSREVAQFAVRFSDGARWLETWSPEKEGPLPEATGFSLSLRVRRKKGSRVEVGQVSLEQVVIPACRIGE